jgi:hypothetical protein
LINLEYQNGTLTSNGTPISRWIDASL